MFKFSIFAAILFGAASLANAQQAQRSNLVNISVVSQEVEQIQTPVKILRRPKAAYADPSICIKGTVTLRITFQADGEVGKISVVSGLPRGFTESAVDAARKIKFVPAKANGKSVTSTKILQYSFGF